MTETARISGKSPEGERDAVALPRASEPKPPTIERIRLMLPTMIAVGLIVTVWELFNVVTGSPDYVLPPLHDILYQMGYRAFDKLIPATWITFQEIVLGFSYGTIVGLSLGTAIFHSRVLRQAMLPLVIGTQSIPVIAIAPILIIWFGFGMAPKVIVAALIVFFPVCVTTISGLASVERDMINLMESLGASKWQIFSKVRFPAALPFIFAGLKNAAAIAAIGAIVGEWVGAHEGLGPVMIASNAAFKTATTFAAIFYLAIISVSMFLLVSYAERRFIPWHFLKAEKQF